MAAIIVGVPTDDGVSDALKVQITQGAGESGDISVVGYMLEGSSFSLSSVWEAPFEGDHLGNAGVVDKGAQIYQTVHGETFKTQFNSNNIWQGTEPPEVTLVLYFHAYSDAKREVDDPIRYLLQMASPELKAGTIDSIPSEGVIGREPPPAMFDIGRRLKLNMRIKDVQYDLTAPKTKDGYFANNTVTITAAPKAMFNRSQIPNMFK